MLICCCENIHFLFVGQIFDIVFSFPKIQYGDHRLFRWEYQKYKHPVRFAQ